MQVPWRFRIMAGWIAVGAAFHGVTFALAVRDHAGALNQSDWRHLLFVLIDGGMAVALLCRPPLLIPALLLFLGQQTSTHGVHAWQQWSAQHTIDWISVGVLASIVVALALVLNERRHKPVRQT